MRYMRVVLIGLVACALVGLSLWPASTIRFTDTETLQAKADAGCTEVGLYGIYVGGAASQTPLAVVGTWYSAIYDDDWFNEETGTDPLDEWSRTGATADRVEFKYVATDGLAAEIRMKCTVAMSRNTTGILTMALATDTSAPLTNGDNLNPRLFTKFVLGERGLSTAERRFTIASGSFVGFGYVAGAGTPTVSAYDWYCHIQEVDCFSNED